MDEINFLKNMPIFADLSDKQINILLKEMRRENFPANVTIIKEGEEGDCMYILEEGEVEISQSLTLSREEEDIPPEKTISKLSSKNHAFFGEIGLLEKNVRTATVSTVSPCKVIIITKESFEKIGMQYPEIGYKVTSNIAKILCSRLRKANENVLKLTTALSIVLT